MLEELVDYYSDVDITIYCFDEISNQLNRARERILARDKELKPIYAKKGISINYSFHVKRFRDPLTFGSNELDLILTFQNLHFIDKGDRYSYFENLGRMLTDSGLVVMAQTTNHSDVFPHPLTLAYLSVEGFHGYPQLMKWNNWWIHFSTSILQVVWTLFGPYLNRNDTN